jgi:hypothetical protein
LSNVNWCCTGAASLRSWVISTDPSSTSSCTFNR